MNHTPSSKTLTIDPASLQPWAVPGSASEWCVRPTPLEGLANQFSPISLKEMDSISLLNRTDTKFLISDQQLLSALAGLEHDYQILSVGGQRLNHYRTLYFDTPNFDLFNLHVNQRADCYKVRSREYADSGDSFLEVKHKTRQNRTIKNRIPTTQPVIQMTLEAEYWLNNVLPYDSRSLEPKLWNTFTRITLASKERCERVTLDVDLTFFTAQNTIQLDGIAIAEVKMNSCHQPSPFLAQMQAQKLHPRGFSKYCIGVSMLYDHVKKNALKPKLLWVEKMIKGLTDYE